jgi:hypothetical protein
MIPYNGFILSIIMMLHGSVALPVPDKACQPMSLSIEVSPATAVGATISLDVPVDANLRVFLSSTEDDGPPKEVKLANNKLHNVAPGSYDLIVQDQGKKYCSELRRLTVNE